MAGNEIVLPDGEVIEPKNVPGALAEITRAESMERVETARRYRRSIDHFMKTTFTMLNYSPTMAGKFRYKLPKRGQDGQPIQGVSIVGAKLLASAWGNLHVEGGVISQDDRFVTARGTCTDLESNFTFRTEVKVSIRDRQGRIYSEDGIKNACGAAESKAIRNAILGVIPPMFVAVIEEEAIRLTRGDAKSLPERTQKAIAWFGSRGVTEDRVLHAIGCPGRADVTLDHLATLQGFKTAIEEGSNPEEVFPRLDGGHEPKVESRSASLRRILGEKKNGGHAAPAEVVNPIVPQDVIEAEVVEVAPSREPGEDG